MENTTKISPFLMKSLSIILTCGVIIILVVLLGRQSEQKNVQKSQEIVSALEKGTPEMTPEEQQTMTNFIVNNPTTPSNTAQDAEMLKMMAE